MNFTDSQLDAIRSRGSSILVSAGAGSGKTRVLTERLMAYIVPEDAQTKPEEISAFLVITFTRAAAAELRSRITGAITARLQNEPENARLRRQLMLSRTASICTIDAFCADLLRENASAAGVSPSFRILEEEHAARLRESALERVLERYYAEKNQAFLELADSVGGGRDDSRLTEQVLRLHTALQSHENPEGWAKEQLVLFQETRTDFGETPWGKVLLNGALEEVCFRKEEMERCLCDMADCETVSRAYEKSFSETLSAIRRLEKALSEGWNATAACFPIPFPRIGGIMKNPDPDLTELLKARRDGCKKAMQKLEETFSEDSAAVLKELNATAPAMGALIRLVLELEREFQEAKYRVGGLDFNDIEHRALRLLTEKDNRPSPLALSLRNRYTEILVDEYQDVSRIQDALFHALSRDGSNLFFVGDIKQSIYRFRLADPGIFTGKTRLFTVGKEGRLISLQENFRSRREVLESVNSVFLQCMSEGLGDLDYGPKDRLIAGATYPDTALRPELILLDRREAENGALEAEAEAVAVRILQLMREAPLITEDGAQRPLRFSDIAVLLRAANTAGPVFRRVLTEHGIPVTAGVAGDFYGSVEVSTVFAMLTVLDNPHQDIPLLTLLRSPCMGFSADRLSEIRALNPDSDFYNALTLAPEEDAKSFLRMLFQLRTEAPDQSASELVERIIEALDLYAVCAAMPDGDRRMNRLQDLIKVAESFRASGDYGLHQFLLWLRNLEERGREPAGSGNCGDAVQILSIHKSKGLEFPVVFCSGLGRSFNLQDIRGPVLIHPTLGLGPRFYDAKRKLDYPTKARTAIEASLTNETLSEEMRLLYVAMTRARELLILTACVRNPEEQLARAAAESTEKPDGEMKKLPAPLLRTAQAPIHWILPAASAFAVTLYSRPDEAETEKSETELNGEGTAETELDRILERNLSWVYPFAAATVLPSKVTATGMKGQDQEDPDAVSLEPGVDSDCGALKLPDPITGMKCKGEVLKPSQKESSDSDYRVPVLNVLPLSAARRGTATHLVLQQIDFEKTGSLPEIEGEIRRLEQNAFLSTEEAEGVDARHILEFFASPLGKRIRKAKECWREFRFSLLNDAQTLYKGAPEGEQVLLQGIVDCCFREEDGLILVDYKTDRVNTGEEILARAAHYRGQLETYATALQRIFGLPVTEMYLYFLHPGRELRLA